MDERDQQSARQILGQSAGVAFARRGREVQLAFDKLVEICAEKREDWLTFVRLSLGRCFALAGSTAALQKLVSPEQYQSLEKLRIDLRPQLRIPPAPSPTQRVLQRALAELRESIERFNQRWQQFLAKLDLQHVNDIRERYNRYYLLEKECALGSTRVARSGFQKLNPVRPEDLLQLMPLLQLP